MFPFFHIKKSRLFLMQLLSRLFLMQLIQLLSIRPKQPTMILGYLLKGIEASRPWPNRRTQTCPWDLCTKRYERNTYKDLHWTYIYPS